MNTKELTKKYISKELEDYILTTIMPYYKNNDKGHLDDHIYQVLNRSFKFSKNLKNINLELVYIAAMMHDMMYFKDKDNHHLLAAEYLIKDEFLNNYFNKKEIILLKEAIEDHRASNKNIPRNIYGKILSSADKNTNINIIFKRTHQYTIKYYNNLKVEEIINRGYNHIKEKYGKDGYANKTIYFKDEDFDLFLTKLEKLTSDYELFKKEYIKINKL